MMSRPEWHSHEIYRDYGEFDSDPAPVEMTGETDYIEDYDLAAAIDEMNETAGMLDYSF